MYTNLEELEENGNKMSTTNSPNTGLELKKFSSKYRCILESYRPNRKEPLRIEEILDSIAHIGTMYRDKYGQNLDFFEEKFSVTEEEATCGSNNKEEKEEGRLSQKRKNSGTSNKRKNSEIGLEPEVTI